MNVAEATGVLFAIAYLVLAIRESRWCWPAGIASSLVFLGVFWAAGLYMQAALHVFYAGMGAYGWWAWRPGGGHAAPAVIHRWPLRRHALAVAAIVASGLLAGALLARYTAAEMPYVDALVSAGAVFTTWLVARKVLENWYYWFVIDAATLFLALGQGLYQTAALFAGYLVLVVLGWRQWSQSLRRQARDGMQASHG